MKKITLCIVSLMLLFVAGCGGPAATPTAVPVVDTPTSEPTPMPDTAAGAVNSLEDVQKATIQIESQGSFVDPAGEQSSTAGRGSGFIIDPTGIAVTNNHVVAGAALLKVWVGGESKTYNARVLGVSECADLAVIDIAGDGFPFLAWYDGTIRPSMPVYATGFPLGDPEYTITDGIISKRRADGETNWASLNSVLEHTATINPGNSGGPLVTEDGQVVGINYRTRADTNQYYAIDMDQALPIIERLRAGEDVESIGINAEAVQYESDLSGVWAASVQSGSVADKAGLKGGDIVTQIEGVDLAQDGTMADYCDIIRTHDPDDTLNIQVVRFATQEVWEGQLNGRPLALSFSFEETAQGDVTDTGETADYDSYVTVEDESGAITMEVPEAWDAVDGSLWLDDNGDVLGAQLSAEPSGEGARPFVSFLATPISEALDIDNVLDTFAADYGEICATTEERSEYEDGLYTGKYDYYTGCGDADEVVFVIAAMPEEQNFLVLVVVQALTEADLSAADRIFDTFKVVGELPGTP